MDTRSKVAVPGGAGSSAAPRHPGGRDDAHRELEREAGPAADAGLQVVVRDAHDVGPLRQDLPSSASSATVQSLLESLHHFRLRNDRFVKVHECTQNVAECQRSLQD